MRAVRLDRPNAVFASPDVMASNELIPIAVLLFALFSVPVVSCPRMIELVKLSPPDLASERPSILVAAELFVHESAPEPSVDNN